MSKYICKKVVEYEEKNFNHNEFLSALENVEFNKSLFTNPFHDHKNKLMILCLLSLIVYKYEHKDMIYTLAEQWGLKCKIYEINDIVFGIFYNSDFLVTSFKGTSNFKEVISDLTFVKVDDNYCIPGKFHKGFHDLLLDEETKTAEFVEKKINKILSHGKQTNVYITGHSLGAALATVFFSYLENSPLSDKGRLDKDVKVDLTTFGCPRVGDKQFSKALKKTTRVVHGNDIITKVPLIFFRHPDNLFRVGKLFSFRIFSDHHIGNYYRKIANL